MRNYVPIDVDNMPDIFDIELAGDTYTFRVDYNDYADYYTLTMIKDDNTIISQEPLLLGQLVGIDIPSADFPQLDLKVMDETNTATNAGKGNLGNTVYLYIDDVDPNGSETGDPTIKPLGYDPDESSYDQTDEEVSY